MPFRPPHIPGILAIRGTSLCIFGSSDALAFGRADLTDASNCTTIDDFDSIVIPELCWDDSPGASPAYSCWYDVSSLVWSQVEFRDWGGTMAMAIRDSGWTNGVYAIFQSVVPESGMYHVSVRMHVIENTLTNGLMAYQIGVAVPGAHRGSGALPPCPIHGSYRNLTPGNDTAAGPQIVRTNEFEVQAGQDVLIAFSTDVTSGDWNRNSVAWNDTYILVDDIELCPGPVVCPACDEIPAVEPIGPLVAGAPAVTVTGVNLGANFVNVYVNGIRTGRLDKQGSGGADAVVSLDRPLARGDRVRASQSYLCDLTETEGCLATREAVVGSGPSAGGIRLTLGLRETGTTAPIGGDGGYEGPVKWVGASSLVNGVPMGKLLTPSPEWQTVTFDPRMDPVLDTDGVLDWVVCDPVPRNRVVLESLAIAPDPASRNPGPYVLHIDDTYGAMGGQSLRVEFQFINEEPVRWVRLTTFSLDGYPSPYLPNPVVLCDRPITMRILLLPYDNDCDGIVNHADLCPATPAGAPVKPTGCSPGDFGQDGDVDAADFLLFQACFSGPQRPPPESCSVDADLTWIRMWTSRTSGCFNST